MRSIRILAAVLGFALACGSSAQAPETPSVRSTADSESNTTSSETASPTPVADAPIEEAPKPVPPPVPILNGRLYDGYIVGGLPNKEQFASASEKGIDSAMSLMSNDEEGIREIAPYASSIGVRYLRFTVRGTEDLNESMAWQFASTLSMVGKPAIIHSAGGERVGAMFALMAFFVDEASAEEALAIGNAAGMGSLEAHIRSLLIRE